MRSFLVLCSLVGICISSVVGSQLSSGANNGYLIGSNYTVYNFTQRLDHNSSANTTFNQRYQIFSDHFQPGGPILLYQTAESDIVAVENSNFFDIAEELGALVISLEHRFFGTSLPQMYNGTLSDLAPLTMENVLEDAVTFLNFVKQNVTGAANSKVIVTGGIPYTSLQLKYPKLY